MESPAIAAVVRMMASLPEATQRQVAEHLRDYLDELFDEVRWDEAFEATEPHLVAATQRAKQEISAGQAQPLDLDRL